ncbi:hypothetical protein D5S17_33665 [Pseudonocardiaceae bacterium YIM PH 21723]|nr:hypothetical protein D5S17_33665 [Pseudonocardiaceae bacterium YIM PH 21723]
MLRHLSHPVRLSIGLVGGIVVGLLFGHLTHGFLDMLGAVYTVLIQFLVLPVLFTAIVTAVLSLRVRHDPRAVLAFTVSAGIAALLGLAAGSPDSGMRLPIEEISYLSTWSRHAPAVTVLAALLVGVLLIAGGEGAIELHRRLRGGVDRLFGWLLKFAPLGIFGMAGGLFAHYGLRLAVPLLVLLGGVFACCLLLIFVGYPLALRAAGVRPADFLKVSRPAVWTAFRTSSSGAALPFTTEAAVRLGVPEDHAEGALRHASRASMDGCGAVYPAAAALVLAHLFGLQPSLGHYLLVVGAAMFAAIATEGVVGWLPGLLLAMTLTGFDAKAMAVGLVLVYGLDPLLDKARSAANVAGQIALPLLSVRQRERALPAQVV